VPQHAGFQHFAKPFDSLSSGTWQGNDISGTVRTLPVNYPPSLCLLQDDRKTAAANASNGMVMGAVLLLCEFSQLVNQLNHTNLSLTALDNAQKLFY